MLIGTVTNIGISYRETEQTAAIYKLKNVFPKVDDAGTEAPSSGKYGKRQNATESTSRDL